MNSFLVAVQVVLPMAMLMAIGVAMRKGGITDRETMKKVDKMSFKVFIPMVMFKNVYTMDLSTFDSPLFIVYGLLGLTVMFLVALFLVPRLMKRRDSASAMGQAIMRPNYILFGVAVAESIYGDGNISAIMLLGAITIPVFNAMSTVVLEVGRNSSASFGKLMKAVATNPLLVTAAAAILLNATGIRLPAMVEDVAWDIAALATPLSFLSLGVSLNVGSILGNRRTLAVGVLTRLVLVPAVFLGLAVLLGIRGPQLCGLMILFAAPTAVSSYPMAIAMDADGELAGQMVVFTTLGSLATIFLWVLGLGSFGLL